MTCGSSRFTLLTLPVEDYPALPEMPTRSGTVPADVFAHAVAQVAVAAGRDDTLPILTGIRVEIDGDTVTMAATDRYRLAIREFTWKPEQPGSTATALVPAKTLADAAKALSGEVELALSSGASGEGIVGLASGGRRTTSRLLEGDFPKYRSLLPSESSSYATVATAPFLEAVRRVALVAERNTPVRLSFSAGELLLEAGSGDEAQASEVLESSLDGRRHRDRVQPDLPARRAGRAGHLARSPRVHDLDEAGGHHRLERRRGNSLGLPAPADAGPPLGLTGPRAHRSGPSPPRTRGRIAACRSDSWGSAAWAATWWSGSARPATRPSGTTATPPSPTWAAWTT